MVSGKKISLIIPQGRRDITPCVESINSQLLDKRLFEVIVVKHQGIEQTFDFPFVRTITVENNSTTLKRNIGAKNSQSEILCFIDDDVLLPELFLSKCVDVFEKISVDIIGGPNLGFPNQSFSEYLSDILMKYSAGNGIRKKFIIGDSEQSFNKEIKTKDVSKNLSTCNLLVSKTFFLNFGGFDNRLGYGGEDTEFLYRAEKSGAKLLYDPAIFLWHQRRSFPIAHTKQLFTWGKNNGKLLLFHPSLILRSDFIFPPLVFFLTVFLFLFLPFSVLPILIASGFFSIFFATSSLIIM